MEIEKINENKYTVRKSAMSGMNTDVMLYTNKLLLERMSKDHTLQQAANASTLPGLAGNVMVMPDGHEGYGFPIGGVMGFDAEEGIVSPGAVGFDINCGVRLIKTNLSEKEVRDNVNALSDALFKNIPSGVGSRLQIGLTNSDLEKICEEGASYIIQKGFGTEDDINRTEEMGGMAGADFSKVSKEAKSRGLNELGTLGAGNHFLEVQKVEKTFDEKAAKAFGLHEGQIVIMVHTGSRGFGHQICSDYLRTLVEYQRSNGISLVDPELSYAKIGDKEASDYLAAMKSAVNFAFTNRQIITNSIRRSFEDTFGKSADALGMDMLYDLSHNIVKLEEHFVDGVRKKVYVHRKGATRAFAKDHPDVPKLYRGTGQPVLIPGSMGTASYVLYGADGAMKETFGSACHGAGRVMSRHQALGNFPQLFPHAGFVTAVAEYSDAELASI